MGERFVRQNAACLLEYYRKTIERRESVFFSFSHRPRLKSTLRDLNMTLCYKTYCNAFDKFFYIRFHPYFNNILFIIMRVRRRGNNSAISRPPFTVYISSSSSFLHSNRPETCESHSTHTILCTS